MLETRTINSFLSELSLGGICALITVNLTRLQRKITSCYPSLMRCWNGLQNILSSVSLMGTPGIIKSQSTQMTKVRLLSHAHVELMHTDECRSGCAVLQLLSNDA